jgi:hypothetical protein
MVKDNEVICAIHAEPRVLVAAAYTIQFHHVHASLSQPWPPDSLFWHKKSATYTTDT